MRVYLALVRRDLTAYLTSLSGYLLMAVLLFLTGVSFIDMVEALNNDAVHMPLTELFFGTPFFWLILLVVPAPVITMRLYALEKFSGTYETLMTTPVNDLDVVLAKFTAALGFYLIALVPLVGALAVVRHYTVPGLAFEWGLAATTLGGVVLMGASYLAMGCLASALTRSQIIAATVSFAFGVSLFLLSFLKFSVGSQTGGIASLVNYVSLFSHMEDFVRGVVDTRPLVFHLSLTGFLLFLNLKVVESHRWK